MGKQKDTYHNRGTVAGKIYERLNFLTSNPKKYDAALEGVTGHADRKAKKYEIMHDLLSHKMGHHLFTETLLNNIASKAQYHRELANVLRSKPSGDRRKHLDQVYGLGIKMKQDSQKAETTKKKPAKKKPSSSSSAKDKSNQLIIKVVRG